MNSLKYIQAKFYREDQITSLSGRDIAWLIELSDELLAHLKGMHDAYCQRCAGGCSAINLIAKAEGWVMGHKE